MPLSPRRWKSAFFTGISSLLTDTLPFRPLFWVFVFHVFFSFVYITIFARMFSYGRRMMLLHLLLVVGGLLFLTLLFAGLSLFKVISTSKSSRLLFAICAAICFSLLSLLYIGNAASNYFWHDNLSYRILVNNLNDLNGHLQALQISPYWAYVALALGFAVTLLVYFKLSRSILVGFEEAAVRLRRYGLFRDRRRNLEVAVVVGLILLAYGATLAVMLGKLRGGGPRQSEPILSFFYPRFFTDRRSVDARPMAERQIRSQYVAPPNFERKNVILIIADSMRADRTSAYGYQRDTTPFLRELIQRGEAKKVNLALANCSFSTCGILGSLTSRNPEEQDEGNLKLYDLLYDQGYRVYLILSGDHSGMPYLRRSYGESINLYFDGSKSKSFVPNDDRVLFEGLDQVPAYHGVPAFFYIHVMSSHLLGIELPGYQKYQPVPREAKLTPLRSYDPVELNNSYDNRMVQADDVIRQVLNKLTEKGYLKDSLVVILSDHGQSLGEHDNFGHGKFLYQEELNVPLLIYDNPGTSYRNLDFATQIDIAPTIFARLGLPIPRSWEGRSLLDPDDEGFTYHQTYKTVFRRGQGSKIVPARAAMVYRARDAIYKYIYSEEEQKEELYELRSDPAEKNNVIATADKELLVKMREMLEQHVRKVR